MVEDKPEKPTGAGVSAYLQRPLRTLEKAQEDRERALHRLVRTRLVGAAPLDHVKPQPEVLQRAELPPAGHGIRRSDGRGLQPPYPWLQWEGQRNPGRGGGS